MAAERFVSEEAGPLQPTSAATMLSRAMRAMATKKNVTHPDPELLDGVPVSAMRSVFDQDAPVPGMPMVRVVLPLEENVTPAPLPPKRTLALFLLKFSRIPGAIRMVRRKRNGTACLRLLRLACRGPAQL